MIKNNDIYKAPKGKKDIVVCHGSYCSIKPDTKGPYTFIYLIRHCHPQYSLQKKLGDDNMPLSEIGKRQRSFLNKKLAAIDLDKIYVSELVRAIETIEPFAKKTGKSIDIDKKFNEIKWDHWYKIKYFNMSEKSRKKNVANYREMDAELDRHQSKARRILSNLWKNNKGKRVAVCCHGNIIKTIITSILNTDVIGFLSFEVYQSSVTKLVIDKDGYIKINYINNFAHLPKKPDEDLFLALINQ